MSITANPGTAPAETERPSRQPADPRRRRGSAPRRRSGSGLTSRVAVNAFLVVFAVYSLLPLAWLLIASTKNHRDLFATNPFALGDFNLVSNLHALFTVDDGIYLRWFGNSVLYTVVGSLLSTVIAVTTGYAFDKYEWWGKEKLFGLVLVGMFVPSAVIQLPLYLLFSEAHLVNTYWSLLLPALVNPFGVYLARVFSEGYVPGEVLEAARVDGAGEFRTFGRVSLPMLTPGFMTIFLFTFTAQWNNFYGALMMLNDEELYPVNLGLFMWNKTVQQRPEHYSLVIVGALVAVIPLIVAFLCLQRYWRSGMTAGAVK
ncbi:carbohydrate ABC transporter permease [Streptomyces sp. NPDC005463]|uniref:carbohydrate ABC transporter permease n=1 Tax=Streptomyces sp. NPDC005463 TaxID=3154465 RepID=UPI00339F1DB1